VPADLAGHLEDRELRRPGGEEAFAAEVVELAEQRERRVIGGLGGDVVELGAAEREASAAAGDLLVGDAQQAFVEPGDGRLVTGAAQVLDPAFGIGRQRRGWCRSVVDSGDASAADPSALGARNDSVRSLSIRLNMRFAR